METKAKVPKKPTVRGVTLNMDRRFYQQVDVTRSERTTLESFMQDVQDPTLDPKELAVNLSTSTHDFMLFLMVLGLELFRQRSHSIQRASRIVLTPEEAAEEKRSAQKAGLLLPGGVGYGSVPQEAS